MINALNKPRASVQVSLPPACPLPPHILGFLSTMSEGPFVEERVPGNCGDHPCLTTERGRKM